MRSFLGCRKGFSRRSAVGRASIEVLEERRLLSTIYVDASSPGPTRDGTSWGNAYSDLQLALGAAVSGDTIRVADGTYKSTTGTDRGKSFQLKSGVGIYGGYAGYGAADPNARSVTGNPTVLSGNIGAAGSSDNSYHVVVASGVTTTSVLDGFTITAGNANGGTSPHIYGGGVYNSGGNPTIANCTFTGNSASSYGGGTYNTAFAAPSFVSCAFSDNSSASYGGGMFNAAASPTLTNCLFRANTASTSGGGMGNSSSSVPVLTNCAFVANTASSSGGAIANFSSSPGLANCILWGNTPASPQIYQSGGKTTATYCDIQSGFTGEGNINVDPLFVRNPSVGADGKWHTNDDDLGDLRLMFASPCIDAGNNGAIPAAITTDLTGNARFADISSKADTGLGTAPIVDIGALETRPGPIAVLPVKFTAAAGGSTMVFASALTEEPGPLTYQWEWTGDGLFDDADGETATFYSTGLVAGTVVKLLVRVVDASNRSDITSSVIVITRAIHVDASSPGPTRDGSSWATAYVDLQQALTAAVVGDSIHVANGTYKPTSTTNRTIAFQLKTDVGVYGGYAGYGAPDPDARDIVKNRTLLSGDIGVVGISSDNSYHVVMGSGTTSREILDGFTITAGNADGASPYSYGGGMYNSGGTPTIRNCTLLGNQAVSNGGGIYNTNASLTLVNCTFALNSATSGGGMGNAESSSSLTNCVFAGNSASSHLGGGGFANGSLPSVLVNCTFSGNSAYASSYGGGAVVGPASMTNCIIWGNGNNPVYSPAVPAAITYSDVEGGYAGTGNVDVDPKFIRSPWVGVDGLPGTADDDLGDLRLRDGSPVLNIGDNSAIPANITTDLAGNDRIGNGTVDLGAYEGPVAAPVAKIIHVDVNAPGVNTGTSWLTAYVALQSALATSVDGDTIRVANGTYKSTTGLDRTISFPLRTGVVICGGYAGYGASDPNARDIANNRTILSGDIGVPGDNTDNSYHVLTAVGVSSSGVLDGVTITAGYANGTGGRLNVGGGLLISNCSPTLNNCTFNDNWASRGGGVYNDAGASPKFNRCDFIGNRASSDGGALYSDLGTSPTLSDCTLAGNVASKGGGMYNASSLGVIDGRAFPTLLNCAFSGNTVYDEGGGMYNGAAVSPTLINCVFTRNTAFGRGGGLFSSGSAVPAKASLLTLAGCMFNGNLATFEGGGVFSSTTALALTNCAFTANSVSMEGGGMYSGGPSTILTNCTFSANTAKVGGGAMYNGPGSVTLTNCIVWNSGDGAIYNYFCTPTITYSDIEGGHDGTGNIDADPRFIRSPWAGPDGAIGTDDDDYGDLRLRVGSPALDVGLNEALPAGVTTDAAGNTRIQNGIVDLGAYEGTAVAPPAKVVYVDLNAAGANTGVSWDDAFTSIQPSLLAVVDGDTIRVADGVYRPTPGADRTISFVLRSGVGVYGGFAGYGSSNPDARDIANNRTILSGDIGMVGDNSDNSYHVLIAAGLGRSAVVDGVTITEGNSDRTGGGMYNLASSPTLSNCRFVANSASTGGGMHNEPGASPVLVNCAFIGNSASGGGGMSNYSKASPTLTNCTFIGNAASNEGGGIFSYYADVAMINCTIFGNSSASHGSGIYSDYGQEILTNCIVWGSTEPIFKHYGTAAITYTDIQGGYTGTGNINADPRFVRNPTAGSDGKWGTTDDDYGDLRLLSASPAINVGSNAAVPAGVTTDLAGNPRIVGAAVDMGAYEYSPTTLTYIGSAENDALYARLTVDQTQLQVWSGSGPDGTLLGSYPAIGPGFVFDVCGGSNSLVMDLSNGVPAIQVNLIGGSGADTLTLAGIGTANSLSVQAGKIVFGAATIYAPGVDAVLLDAPAGSAIAPASLTLSMPVSLVAGKGLVLRTGSLNITGAGSLDLAGNSMILDYAASPVSQVRGWINNGRLGLTPSLRTSGAVTAGTATLGMVDNALLHLSSFAGQSLGGVFSQLLIRPTVSGDANLDGVVDSADYMAVVANMGRANAQWFLGDLNCDGSVTADDFAEVTSHLGDRAAEGFQGSMVQEFKGAIKAQEFKGSKVQGGKSSKVQKIKSAAKAAGKAKVPSKGKVQKEKGKMKSLLQR